MDLLWATCTDGELAACHAAIMAEIPGQEATWTLELMLQWTTLDEKRPVVGGLKASMPTPAFAEWLTGAEQALSAEAFVQLRALLAEPSPATSLP